MKPRNKKEALDFLLDLEKRGKLRKKTLIYQITSLRDVFINDLLQKIDFEAVTSIDAGNVEARSIFDNIIGGACRASITSTTPTEANMGEAYKNATGQPNNLQKMQDQEFHTALQREKEQSVNKADLPPIRNYSRKELVDALLKAAQDGKLEGNVQHGGDVDLIPRVETAAPNELEDIARYMIQKGLIAG